MTDSAENTSKSNLLRVLGPLVAIALLVWGALSLIQSQLGRDHSHEGESAHPAVVRGSTVEDFNLEKLDGSKIKASSLQAKVLFLNFWATWCEACMVEMPSIIRLQEKFKNNGLVVAGVNLDVKPQAVVPKTVKKLGMNFPVFMDPNSDLAEIFDVHGLPLTVVMDQNRKVLLIHSGEEDWFSEKIQKKFAKWLN